MADIFLFIEFLTWIFQTVSFLFGLVIGLLAAGALATIWKRYRRVILRRNWRKDRPRRAWQGLPPEWQDYDPEVPEISSRCICHNRVIYPGERVLIWPEVGPAGLLHMAVYCEAVKNKLWEDERAEDVEPADGRRA